MGKYVMVCTEERGLDLGDGLLGRCGIHRRTQFPQLEGKCHSGVEARLEREYGTMVVY